MVPPYPLTRRRFLAAAAVPAATAAIFRGRRLHAALPPELVRFTPETEPLVKLIVRTPRERCVEVMVGQFRRGLPYRHFLAALYLTAIRAAPYHGTVHGFDHNAYSVHSAHQLALDLPPDEMLLPALWAMDSLKSGSPKNAEPSVRLGGKLPPAERIEEELRAGVEGYDPERAVRAAVAAVRSLPPRQVGDCLWQFAGRDWFFIGHLAILVANSWRLLQTVGWQHAEPLLHYVVSGLSGMAPGESDLRHHAENEARVDRVWKGLPAGWSRDAANEGVTRELLEAVRRCDASGACDAAAAALAAGGASAGAVWDAVFLAAGEMVMCAQKNSTPLHANTAANALRFAFGECGGDRARMLILLQAVAWMTNFRRSMAEADWLRDPVRVTDFAPEEAAEQAGRPADEVAAEILSDLSHGGRDHGEANASAVPGWHGRTYNRQPWRLDAARKAFALERRSAGFAAASLFRTAARLLPPKADGDPHRIKFPTAMFENCRWVTPPWRPHLVGASTYACLGTDAPDTALARQLRDVRR